MRRILGLVFALSALALLAGCAANPSLSNFTSSFAPFTLMVWLFAVSAIGLLTGCGGDNSSPTARPNTFTGSTSTTGNGTTGGTTTGTTTSGTTTSATTTGSTSGTTTSTQQNQLAFLTSTNVTTPPQALVTLPPIQVALEDPNGNILTGASGNVTIALGSGAPANAVLQGTLTQPAVNGVATFNDLKINIAGPETLVASCPNFLPAQTVITLAPLGLGFDGRIDEPFVTFPGASVVSADLNGDRNPDLVISGKYFSGPSSGGVAVMLANADGTYRPPTFTRVGNGNKYGPMVAADFNHDGNTDVFVASAYSSSGHVNGVMLLGNGLGGFTEVQNVALPTNDGGIRAMAVGNFDGDPDIAYVTGYPQFYPFFAKGEKPHKVFAFHVSPSGSVSTGSPLLPGVSLGQTHPSALAVGDFNGDHHLDLVVSGDYVNTSNSSITGLTQTFMGDGSSNPFSPGAIHTDYLGAFVPTALAAGHLEGDTDDVLVGGVFTTAYLAGNSDKYFSNYLQAYGPPAAQVLIGVNQSASHSGPAFANVLPPVLMTGAPSSMTLQDIDRNGTLDLVAQMPAVRGLGSFPGLGGGQFGNESFSTIGGGQSFPLFKLFTGVTGSVPAVKTAVTPNSRINPETRIFFPLADLTLPVGNTLAVAMPQVGNFKAVTANWPGRTISVVSGHADGSFVTPPTLAAGNLPRGVAMGDLNGDKIPDLAWTAYSAGGAAKLFTALGTNSGTFNTPVSTTVPGLGITGQVFIGNFEGDAAPAVGVLTTKYANPAIGPVSFSTSRSASLFVVPTDGQGHPQPANTHTTNIGKNMTGFAVGDLNGDGFTDIAWTSGQNGSGGTYVGLNKGNGYFSVSQIGPSASGVAIADVNNDKVSDLVVAYSNGLAVLLGKGSGATFSLNGAITSHTQINGNFAINLGQRVAVGDFNGDGVVDVAVATGKYGFTEMQVLHGNNTGYFANTANGNGKYFAPVGNPMALVATDINADGISDVAILNGKYCGSNDVTVLLGTNSGLTVPSFPVQLPGVGGLPNSLVIGDVNGDGKPDIVTSDQQDGTITLLLHT